MKIVYLNPSGQLGGAEAALLDILATVKDAEPSWTLQLIVSADGPLATKARNLGIGTYVLPFPDSLSKLGDSWRFHPGNTANRFRALRQFVVANPGIAAYVSRLRKLLRELGPDVIHSNGFKMHILGALAKPRSVPLIWHIHDYVQSRPLMARLMKFARRRASMAIVNSNSVGSDFRAVVGGGFPIQTIYNGVDTTVFSPLGAQLDLDSLAQLPSANGATLRVGLLATLAHWKGHEVFLRALSLVSPELPVRGYVIGDAIYQTDGSQTSLEELKSLAQRLGIADSVGFTGFVAEPAAAMRALDIVVHASTSPEPFGLVIVEAMACGRPVIFSQAGGAAEVSRPNGKPDHYGETETPIACGYEPGNAEQLANQIARLAADPEMRAGMGVAGRATAQQRFDRTRVATELIPLYTAICRP